MRMHNAVQFTSSLAALCAASLAGAATVKIENATLAVTYDEGAGTFAVAEKASGQTFLAAGRLEGTAAGARTESANDSVFGAGKRIVVTLADGGGENSLELYGDLPFALVRGARHNGGAAQMDVTMSATAAFTLDLGKRAADLRTMGTAGLTAPDKHPGSYLFLTLADPATRRGVVAGWLTNDRGSGVLFSDIKDGKVAFRAQIDYGHLRIPAGQSARLETLALGVFDDARIGEELYADALARQYHIKLHPQINGYCTWYSNGHGGAGDEQSIVELAEFAARELKPFGFSFVQIDDQWQDGGEYNGPRRGFDRVRPNGPYPHGMQPVAERFQQLGLAAGIWFMPFARNCQDPEYKDRQHWFVKRADGKPYETPWGGTSLDLTLPEVQAHIRKLVQTIHGWGYNYFKMDGLWTGSATEQIYVNDGYRDDHIGNNAPFHDPLKTNLEVYRDGLKLVRDAAGPDVFFSGCNVSQNMRSFGGTIGLVDSMRIGPDNGQDWGGLTTGPIRGSRLYFLHGRVWWNDPDPSYVRASIPVKHARLITSWVAISGAFNLNSDWIPGLPAERLDIMKRTMPAHGVTARPVDYFDRAPLPSIWLVTDARHPVRRDVLGLFNWEGKDEVIGCTAAKAGLDPARTYLAFDFWANGLVPPFRGEFACDVPAQSCRVIAVRPDEGHPVLLSTSRHVTQGIVDVTDEQWDGKALSAQSAVVANDPYELRIAGTAAGGKLWKPLGVELSDADRAAGVTASVKEGPGLVRVTITAPVSRTVKWSVRFEQRPLPAAASTVTNLRAEMGEAGEPVKLTWKSDAPFYEIRRDGAVIASGHYGCAFTDDSPPPGKACIYTVKVVGAEAAASTTLTTKGFDPGPVPPLPEASVAKLPVLGARCGWGSMQIGKEVGGAPLKLGGQTYGDGIGLHAEGEAVYACKPEWKRFVAVVGLDDSQRHDPRASVVCKVVAEDAAGKPQTVGATPALRTGKLEQWHFNLTLPAGCAKVRLVVDDAGDGNSCDHADWVNAGFRAE